MEQTKLLHHTNARLDQLISSEGMTKHMASKNMALSSNKYWIVKLIKNSSINVMWAVAVLNQWENHSFNLLQVLCHNVPLL